MYFSAVFQVFQNCLLEWDISLIQYVHLVWCIFFMLDKMVQLSHPMKRLGSAQNWFHHELRWQIKKCICRPKRDLFGPSKAIWAKQISFSGLHSSSLICYFKIFWMSLWLMVPYEKNSTFESPAFIHLSNILHCQ